MVARGHVQNGVVVLEEGVRLPEGQEVIVVAHGATTGRGLLESSGPHSVLDIPSVSLGRVLRTQAADHNLLDEMLEGR
jgi:hypothetical protein